MFKMKQKTSDESATTKSSALMDGVLQQIQLQKHSLTEYESKQNVKSENKSTGNYEHGKFQATRVRTFSEQKKRPDEKDSAGKQEMFETERNQPFESEQDIESREFLETARIKESKNLGEDNRKGIEILGNGEKNSRKSHLKGKEFLRTEAMKSKIRRQGDLENGVLENEGNDPENLKHTHLENRNMLEIDGGKSRTPHKTSLGRCISGENSERGAFTEEIPSPPDEPENTLQRSQVSFYLLRSFWRYYRVRYLKRLKKSWGRLKERWEMSTCRKQLMEATLYYVVSLVVCLICLVLAVMVDSDYKDIPICIMIVIISCCGATLLCKRDCLYKWIMYQLDRCYVMDHRHEFEAEFESVYLERSRCFDCFLCSSEKYAVLPKRGHWFANRRAKLENNTAFQHEVVDVSKLKLGECPQIRQVEVEELAESISPDSNRKRYKRAKVVVHHLETNIEQEEKSYNCGQHQHIESDQNSKPKVERIFPRLPTRNLFTRECKQDMTWSELPRKAKPKSKSTSPQDVFRCEHYGQAVACACPELAEKEKPKVKDTTMRQPGIVVDSSCEHRSSSRDSVDTCLGLAKKHKPEIEDTTLLIESQNDGDFICEHYGRGVACACPELAQKDKPKSTSRLWKDNCKGLELSQKEKSKSKSTSHKSLNDEDVYPEHYKQAVSCVRPDVTQKEKSNTEDIPSLLLGDDEVLTCRHCYEDDGCTCNKLYQSKSEMKSFSSRGSLEEDRFICEHCDHSVACSCDELAVQEEELYAKSSSSRRLTDDYVFICKRCGKCVSCTCR